MNSLERDYLIEHIGRLPEAERRQALNDLVGAMPETWLLEIDTIVGAHLALAKQKRIEVKEKQLEPASSPFKGFSW